ncbi:MAG: ABC transporter permease [Planctomycetes bacterium]|nr:ABC transporter permease [Planctomycetota bacterium]
MIGFVERTGHRVLQVASHTGYAVLLAADGFYWVRSAWQKREVIFQQVLICGVLSLPVVLLVAIFSGMVLALQTGMEMAKFGVEGQIGKIVAASMCREMGPIMTAIIIAGRVGSAMAAELGTMKVSEEIDALEVMSISPVRFLVMPRLLALTLMCPVLTAYADLVGTLGGAVVGFYQLRIPYPEYFRNALDVLVPMDIISGLIKATVFGVVIATVGCSQGLQAENGAEGVGRATRNSVVIAFILVIIFNYFLTSITRHFF